MRHATFRFMRALACVAMLGAGLAGGLAHAAGYPEKTIRLIVPVAAGGTTDLLARLLGAKLSATLGQPVVVENRAGANGNIGMEATANAEPDGYTLLFGTSNLATNPALYPKLPFDPLKAFAPVSLFGSVTNVLVVNPSLPVRSIQELVAYAKANPTALSHGSNGSGLHQPSVGRGAEGAHRIQMVHVPYKGGAPAMVDLLGGQVSMIFDQIPVVLPYIKSGRVRPLGVTAGKRSVAAPDIPTIAEQGLPATMSASGSACWRRRARPGRW